MDQIFKNHSVELVWMRKKEQLPRTLPFPCPQIIHCLLGRAEVSSRLCGNQAMVTHEGLQGSWCLVLRSRVCFCLVFILVKQMFPDLLPLYFILKLAIKSELRFTDPWWKLNQRVENRFRVRKLSIQNPWSFSEGLK